jgi:hypothetical protein
MLRVVVESIAKFLIVNESVVAVPVSVSVNVPPRSASFPAIEPPRLIVKLPAPPTILSSPLVTASPPSVA